MLKFSANLSLLFTEYPLVERFAAARAAGFSAVEIQFPYELPVDAIHQELHANGLQLVLINVPAGDLMQGGDGLAGVPGRETLFRTAVSEALHYARELGVPTVNVLAGRQPDGESRTHCLQTLEANLRHACETLHAFGINTVMEAINTHDMPRFLLHSVAHMQELLTRINHPGLKMQFDCYHMQRMQEDVLRCLQENIRDIGHIQFADVPGRHEPGTGRMNYDEIFALIRGLPYAGWVGAEYRPSTVTGTSMGWLRRWQPAPAGE